MVSRDELLRSIDPDMKPDRDFFLRIYGFEESYPGFAMDALKRLEQAGHVQARKEYQIAVQSINPPTRPAGNTKPLSLTPLSTVQEKEAEWLIPGYVPRGQITLLAGDGGVGKTSIWCNLAAAVSSGQTSILDRDVPFAGQPQRVLFFSSEDSIEITLKARLRKAGAELSGIFTLDLADERFQELKFGSELLETLISSYRPALVIFDPLQSFVPPEVKMSARNEMRNCLNPLVGLGEKYGCSFLIVVHTNKQVGLWGRKRIADSADIWDISRSVLIAGDAGENGIRYISHEKCNYGPLQDTILFRLGSDGLKFEGYTEKRDKDYVLAQATFARQAPARDEAKDLILSYLEDGEKETSDLDSALKAQGVSGETLKRAKSALRKDGKITCFSRGFSPKKFYWKLSPPMSS
jgi:hypothetical protein